MHRFYLNLPITPGDTIKLPTDVVRHIQVLRLRLHNEIVVFNGDGNSYDAEITTLERRSVGIIVKDIHAQQNTLEETTINSISSTHQQPNIHLAMAIIANDKMDLVINAATQLGVTQLTPIISKYSQNLANDKIDKRLEHWKQISISACEQSGRNTLPQINHPIRLATFLQQKNANINLILSLHNDANMRFTINDLNTGKSANIITVNILVGPEGGFTLDEVKQTIVAGYHTLTLNQHILRAEIAAISGIAIISESLSNT